MRPVSARFLAALSEPHTVVSKVTVTPPSGGDPTPLPITDGGVTLDATSENRGSCDLTLADESLIPLVKTDPLTPYGSEIRCYRGLQYPDGTQELVSLGVFGIGPTTVNDGVETPALQVAGIDRSARVGDEDFDKAYQVPKGTLFVDAIADVLAPVFPGLEVIGVEPPISSLTTPFMLAAQEGDDRWEFAQNLAMAIACELYFNGEGIPTLRPGASSGVQWTISEGAGGVLLSARKDWSREGVFNRWLITGENSGETPARGEASITAEEDPLLYFGGRALGKVTRRESLEFVVTDQQAKDVAEMLKAKQTGLTQPVNFGSVVNPALEPDDVVKIVRSRTGIDEAHVIDQLVIPLGFDQPMTGVTRAQTT